jgi:hypothetical protein
MIFNESISFFQYKIIKKKTHTEELRTEIEFVTTFEILCFITLLVKQRDIGY